MAEATAGTLLREAREKHGLHIAALAAAIKVSPRKLDALENDRLAELPDATFARALAQTVCRTLKIDAGPVLERLPANVSTLEGAGNGLNMPFQQRSGQGDGLAVAAIKPMIWAASALMLAAVAVYFLPDGLFGGGSELQPVAALVPAPFPAASAASAAVAPAPTASAAALSAAAAPGSAAVATVETVFALPPAASSAPAGLVQLRTSEATWVEARDGNGQMLLFRTVQPGESIGFDGALPIRLTIGNAAAAQLGFRGQPVDLTPLTLGNVARLELR